MRPAGAGARTARRLHPSSDDHAPGRDTEEAHAKAERRRHQDVAPRLTPRADLHQSDGLPAEGRIRRETAHDPHRQEQPRRVRNEQRRRADLLDEPDEERADDVDDEGAVRKIGAEPASRQTRGEIAEPRPERAAQADQDEALHGSRPPSTTGARPSPVVSPRQTISIGSSTNTVYVRGRPRSASLGSTYMMDVRPRISRGSIATRTKLVGSCFDATASTGSRPLSNQAPPGVTVRAGV